MATVPFQQSDVISDLHNRISNNKYRVFIPDCPSAGDMTDLCIRVQSINIPLSESVNVSEVVINGFVSRKSTGDTIRPSSFSMTIFENNKMEIRNKLKAWKEYCANSNTGGVAVGDASYKRDIQVAVFSDSEDLICTYVIPGCFPITINDLELASSTNPDSVTCNVEFSIDNTAYILED